LAQGDSSKAVVAPLSLAEVWRGLPSDTTLISYFVSPMGAHAWIVDDAGVDHVKLDLGDGRLQRITCWAAQFGKKRGPAEQRSGRVGGECGSDAASSDEVYAALFAPLRSKIRNRNLMIVPHGDLHYVPFAALRDPQHNHYLIQDYTLAYLPSASALPLLRARESPVPGTALVLGDPDAPGQAALPGANLEALRVADMLHAKAMTRKEALKALLYHLDGNVDLLHIAAHGVYDPGSPLFSTIFLAGSGTGSGRLTVDEIQSELDLWGVNLVVLAVCQSGVGRQSGGDDTVSLTRALLYAGSPGVISALWNIDDQGTTPVIEKFYAHFIAGSTAAHALREAQLAMLNDARYSDPHFWAGFLLTGDPKGTWPTRSAGMVSLPAWHESP
jgi:CHAT domain-containing protein